MGRARETAVGRFGLVLYWAGVGFAVLFGVAGGLTLIFGGPHDRVFFAVVWATFAVISFLIGRAALFILGGE
jgi:uncharacterized PurR-regulated membrane protein YhhQ (DUF165 family)